VEHRWGRRISLEVPVRILVDVGEAVMGQIENISISGAFVRTARAVPGWVRLEVEMGRPGEPGREPERVVAYVTRRTKHGVGIEWDELAPSAVRELLARMYPAAARCRRAGTPASTLQAA
jgi:hypothetical protein